VVDDLLYLSQVEAGQEPQMDQINQTSCCWRLASAHRRAAQKNVRISVVTSVPDIKPTASPGASGGQHRRQCGAPHAGGGVTCDPPATAAPGKHGLVHTAGGAAIFNRFFQFDPQRAEQQHRLGLAITRSGGARWGSHELDRTARIRDRCQ
jgi:signal transduction histidine kinase